MSSKSSTQNHRTRLKNNKTCVFLKQLNKPTTKRRLSSSGVAGNPVLGNSIQLTISRLSHVLLPLFVSILASNLVVKYTVCHENQNLNQRQYQYQHQVSSLAAFHSSSSAGAPFSSNQIAEPANNEKPFGE